MHIRLKVGKEMDIGRVVAPVIHAMVDLNFVRMASWEVLCSLSGPYCFFINSLTSFVIA